MKYSTSYRSLVANPRAKMSHKYRALLKRRDRIEATRWIHAKKGGTK